MNLLLYTPFRNGCSLLNIHLFILYIIQNSPECVCGAECEDEEHFLIHCPLYQAGLATHINHIGNIGLEQLLYGIPTIAVKRNITINWFSNSIEHPIVFEFILYFKYHRI